MRKWVQFSSNWLNALWFAVLFLAGVGLFWTPHDPGAQSFRDSALAGPSMVHWMGVDPLGRDLLSRLWRGLGHTVAMSGSAAVAALFVSGLLLFFAESLGRRVRQVVGGLINLWVAVPVVLLGLLLLVAFRPSPGTLIWAAALGNVPLCFRQLRVLWREQMAAPYVEASRALGAGFWDLLRRTIWPNLKPDLWGLMKLLFAISALELSGLAFLGLIGDPDFPELGAILKQHQADLFRAPWLVLWPGLWLSGLLWLTHATTPRETA
jgi:ABC-type dipeptide/oligopeptide/nickel transport system permease subunit